MYLADHAGLELAVDTQDQLLTHLRSVRKGRYGAFVLWHGSTPADVTGAIALCSHQQRRGLSVVRLQTPTGIIRASSRPGCRLPIVPSACIHADGRAFETDGIWALWDAVVCVDVAYKAATEFLQEPVLPASIFGWSFGAAGELPPLVFVIGAVTRTPKIRHPPS